MPVKSNEIHASRRALDATRTFVHWSILVVLLALAVPASCRAQSGFLQWGLRALARNSETVFFLSGDVLNGEEHYSGVSRHVYDAVAMPVLPLLGGLSKAGLNDLYTKKGAIRQIVVGAKSFRVPKGVGIAHYDAFYAICLSSAKDLQLQVRFPGRPAAFIQGKPVWKWQYRGNTEEGYVWNYYILQRDEDVFVSTSLAFLKSVLTPPSDASGSVDMLPGWRELERSAPVWAVRAFQRDAQSRRTVGPGFGAFEPDPRAQGMTFSLDPVARIARLRYLTPSRDDGLLRMWREKRGVSLREVSNGVWEGSFNVDTSDAAVENAVVCVGLLGFGIYP